MKLKYKNASQTLIIELELKNKKSNQPVFTASGSYYDSLNILHDRFLISAGQCLDCIPEFVKTMENKREIKELLEIYELWNEWHLNDMGTWCEHMNYGNFPKQDIYIHHLAGNEEYEKLAKIRQLPNKYLEVTEEGLNNIPRALYDYLSYEKKRNTHIERKSNGWITYDPVLSPEGLLGKECPVCGAKYGHNWYYRPIPANVINRIKKIIGE